MVALFLGLIHFYMKLFGCKNGLFVDDYWFLACLLLELIMEFIIAVIVWEV